MRAQPLLLLASCAFGLLFSEGAMAQAPAQVPIQGFVADDQGMAVDGTEAIVFRIFDAEADGTELYSETQAVLVDQGFFTAYLGDTTSLDLALFRDNPSLFLELEVSGEVLTPRQQLATVPYAGFAAFAGGADFDDLVGVPGDLLDGDNDTTYTANDGVQLVGTNFSVEPTVTQRRVAGACTGDQAIQSIAEDGTVNCVSPPSFTAGNGININAGTVEVDTAFVQQRVAQACGASQAIRSIGSDGTVNCVDLPSGDIDGILTSTSTGLTGGCTSGTCSLSSDWGCRNFIPVDPAACPVANGTTLPDCTEVIPPGALCDYDFGCPGNMLDGSLDNCGASDVYVKAGF